MDLLQALKEDLKKAQRAQLDCVDEYYNVMPHRRYEYLQAVRLAKEIKDSIDYTLTLKN